VRPVNARSGDVEDLKAHLQMPDHRFARKPGTGPGNLNSPSRPAGLRTHSQWWPLPVNFVTKHRVLPVPGRCPGGEWCISASRQREEAGNARHLGLNDLHNQSAEETPARREPPCDVTPGVSVPAPAERPGDRRGAEASTPGCAVKPTRRHLRLKQKEPAGSRRHARVPRLPRIRRSSGARRRMSTNRPDICR
jgi:hypothetical protein